MKKEKIKYGWHVLREDGRIGIGWNNDGRKPKVGQWVRYRGRNNQMCKAPPVVCFRGMHAWNTLASAINYAKDLLFRNSYSRSNDTYWFCRVALKGSITPTSTIIGARWKFAAEERKILWKVQLSSDQLWELFCVWGIENINLSEEEKEGIIIVKINKIRREQKK